MRHAMSITEIHESPLKAKR